MDTNTALATLQAIANTLTDEVKGSQAKLDAVNLAISQLQGTLSTQLTELATAQTALATANDTIATLQVTTTPVVTPPVDTMQTQDATSSPQ